MMSPRIDARRRLGSIRTSLVLLALVPSITLAAVWGVTTARVLAEGWRLRSQTDLSKSTGALGTDVTLALQAERRLSAQWMVSPEASNDALIAQRERTDEAVFELVDRSDELKEAPARISDKMYPVIGAAGSLEYYRSQVDSRTGISAQQVLEQYTDIIGSQISAFQELSQVDDGDLTSEAGPLVSLEHLAELVSREDAALTLAWPDGRLSATGYADFARLVGARRWLVKTQLAPFLTGGTKAAVERITTSGEWQTMESVEDAVIADHAAADSTSAGARLPDQGEAWRSALDKLSQEQAALIQRRNGVLLDHSSARARELLAQAAWVSAGGLAAVLLSVLLSWRITRSLFGRLRGLREATLGLAEQRLPDVVARLHRGERIDVDAEAPDLDYGTDELGRVAQAFNAAQRTAVNTAVELADTRRGFQKVILGVARHTQNLVNRQLSTLDALEREHQDPTVLHGLFELDSTATQMRRYEENLVIISGGKPGRRWSEPVAVVDVLRSAVGEVAEYQRVNVRADGEVRLAAPAVADVIHLLAELIENATVFSPAPEPVQVRADLVARGLAVEVEDRGVGMPEDDYTALNRQLAEPPRFDVMALADDSRLGMFVIGRLAARHGIKVTLRSSTYGGTTAIVLIPDRIVVCPHAEDADQGRDTAAGPDTADVAPQQPQPATAREIRLGLVSAPRMDDGHAANGPGSSNGASAPGRTPAVPAVPAVPADPADPAVPALVLSASPPSASASASASGKGGPAPLPRRVPQTSLVAELRHDPPPAASAASSGEGTDLPAPSPEEAASALAAFQRGTRHARDESDEQDRAHASDETTSPPQHKDA